MCNLTAILISCILRLDGVKLREMFVVANVLAGGLTDNDALDSISVAILNHLQSMTENERIMTLKYIHALKDLREVTP